MPYLIKNKTVLILIFILQSCAYAKISKTESYYKVLKIDNTRTRSEIEVTPDRIITICEKITDEIPDLRGFYFLVLDDKNTVISIIRGNTIDKTVCEREIAKINKIIKNGNRIYFGGMHDALDPDVEEGSEYYFKNHGKFKSNGRVLQWAYIANEKGQCFAAHTVEKKPCPPDNFPIGKDE